jgi:hypothetical protein
MPCTAPVVILAESLLDRDVEKSTLHTFHNIRPANVRRWGAKQAVLRHSERLGAPALVRYRRCLTSEPSLR